VQKLELRRGVRIFRRIALTCGVLAAAPLGCGLDDTSEDSTPAVQAVTSTGLSVSLTYQSDWKAGYCSTVLITNIGPSPISSWQVVISLGQARLSQFWKANTTLAGEKMTVTPRAENAKVAAGATAAFGFCASAAGPAYHPTLVSAASSQGPTGKS